MAKALKCFKEGCTFEVRGNSVDDVLEIGRASCRERV